MKGLVDGLLCFHQISFHSELLIKTAI